MLKHALIILQEHAKFTGCFNSSGKIATKSQSLTLIISFSWYCIRFLRNFRPKKKVEGATIEKSRKPKTPAGQHLIWRCAATMEQKRLTYDVYIYILHHYTYISYIESFFLTFFCAISKFYIIFGIYFEEFLEMMKRFEGQKLIYIPTYL